MATVTERLALLITAQGAQATGEVQKLTGSFGKLNVATLAAGTVAVGFGRFMFDAAEATSNLQEQVSAAQSTFGPATASLREFAKGAEAIGLSDRAALQGANAIGGLFKEAGASQQQAAQLSESTVKLSTDLASFYNVAGGGEQVLQDLRSGLVGETEPLRKFQVFINETTVRAKAMEMGLVGAHGELDDGAKVLARYAIIMDKTTDAQGDAIKTAGSLANQQRQANAALENAQAKLGEATIKFRTELTKSKADAAGFLQDLGDESTNAGRFFDKFWEVFSPATHEERELRKKAGEEAQKSGQKKAEADIKAKKELDSYTESVRIAAGIQREYKQTEEQLKKAREEATDATKQRRNAEEGLQDAQKATATAQRGITEAQEDLNELQRRGAVDAEDVARAKERITEAAKDTTAALEDEARAAKDVESAQRDVADALAEVERVKKGASPRDLKEAEIEHRDAIRDRERALKDIRKLEQDIAGFTTVGILKDGEKAKTTEDKADAEDDLAEKRDAAEIATFRVEDAEKRLKETRERGKPGSKDLQDALDVLAQKQEIVAGKVRDQAAAHENVAAKQRDQIKAGDELAKAEEGDPDFAEKLRDARQKVADAHDNAARAKRSERDATEELQTALENFKTKVTDVAQQGAGTPVVAATAIGGQDFTPVRRNAPVAANGGGGNTFVTVVTGADPNATVRAVEQYAARNGGSPRR